MTIFFTGCTHYMHKSILDFENRPYDNHEEMTNDMIRIWNEQVSDDDIVYHLGDFALTNQENTVNILKQLNGKIRLIKGNHDYSKTWDKIVKQGLLDKYHEIGVKIKYEKNELWLTHYPFEIGLRPRKWSIHSHIHSNESSYLNQINVGVDSPHFKHKKFGELVTMEELFEVMQSRADKIEEKFLESRR